MTDFPDEMLMAYADNELSPRDRALLEARLEVDADLKARLEPFAATGSSLSAFFDGPFREPVPSRLIEAISSLPPPKASSAPRVQSERNGAGWLETIGSFIFPQSPQFASAFGLAALLTIGGVAGWTLGRESGSGNSSALVALHNGELVASGALLAALETSPSQPVTAAPQGADVLPVQSFHSRDGSFCREYRASGQDRQTLAGVACRQSGGTWHVAAHVEAPQAASTGDGYKTASGPGAEALNAVVDALIQGDALGKEDEAAVIARKWKPAAKQ